MARASQLKRLLVEVQSIPWQCGLLYRNRSNTYYQGPCYSLPRCVQIYMYMNIGEEGEIYLEQNQPSQKSKEHSNNLPAAIEATTMLTFLFDDILSHFAGSFFICAIAREMPRLAASVASLRAVPIRPWPSERTLSSCFCFGFYLGRFLRHVACVSWYMVVGVRRID